MFYFYQQQADDLGKNCSGIKTVCKRQCQSAINIRFQASVAFFKQLPIIIHILNYFYDKFAKEEKVVSLSFLKVT